MGFSIPKQLSVFYFTISYRIKLGLVERWWCFPLISNHQWKHSRLTFIYLNVALFPDDHRANLSFFLNICSKVKYMHVSLFEDNQMGVGNFDEEKDELTRH